MSIQKLLENMHKKSFIDQTNDFRADLSERLMRKNNARMWQLRKFPIHKRG